MAITILLLAAVYQAGHGQSNLSSGTSTADESAHSILPADGIISYMPEDTSDPDDQPLALTRHIRFMPTANFFFRPETTADYKEAGIQEDTGGLNFYLRGDFGARLMFPKSIDMVFNLHSYGLYTRALGPLDQNMSLYEAYVDMKQLNRAGTLSLRFGRASLGKYGTEILIGDDDFGRGRSFETVRLRYMSRKSTHDLMWVQLYQAAPDSAGFEWNHPIFLGYFNTIRFSDAFRLDANLPFIIDQYNSGFRTTVLMPDVRVFGSLNQLRYSAEFILQTGSANGIISDDIDGTVSAHAMEVSAGLVSDDRQWAVDVAYYRASGDDKPGDEDIKSYNVLWQNEHRRFGYIDAFKGSNVQAATLHLNWNAGRLVDIGAHAVYANVLEPKDRSTGIPTIPNLNNLETDSKAIGAGGDVYINYFYNQFLNMQFSASVFSPGDYFTEVTGLDNLMVRVYLMLAVRL